MDNTEQIKHVVVLMLENRSFDQMLGDYRNYDGYSNLKGIDRKNPIKCKDQDGHTYIEKPVAAESVEPDPPHELDDVIRQLGLPAPDLPEPPNLLEGKRLERFLKSLAEIKESYLEKEPSYGRAAIGLTPKSWMPRILLMSTPSTRMQKPSPNARRF
jgi:hypothetical protein